MNVTRVLREKVIGGTRITLERSALGQSIEYDVFTERDGKRTYVGGGTKRQGYRQYNTTVEQHTDHEQELSGIRSLKGRI